MNNSLSVGVSQGLPPPSRKKQAVTSLLFQVAEEFLTTQLLEKLKEIETVSPDKIKSEPEDKVLLSISEEPIDWLPRDEEYPNLFGESTSGFDFNFPRPSSLGGYYTSSPKSPTVKLSELGFGNLPALENIRDKDISPGFAQLVVDLVTQTKMVDVKWPIRGSKEAPKFNPAELAELLRYIAQVEEIWEGKTIDKKRMKKGLCKYAPSTTEQEWMAFDTYDEEFSYEKFKEEIINSYPEAAMLEKGSLAHLEQICQENQRIGPKDLKTLLSFKCTFTTEAKKLQKPLTVIKNHALVAKFANCLTDAFREKLECAHKT